MKKIYLLAVSLLIAITAMFTFENVDKAEASKIVNDKVKFQMLVNGNGYYSTAWLVANDFPVTIGLSGSSSCSYHYSSKTFENINEVQEQNYTHYIGSTIYFCLNGENIGNYGGSDNEYTIKATVESRETDTTAPTFDGKGHRVIDVDKPLTVEDLKKTLTAHDNQDGDLTSKIKIESDNYTANKHKTGDWNVDFSVSDNAGNKTEFTIVASVMDFTEPNINFDTTVTAAEYWKGNDTFTLGYKETITINTIKSHYKVTDNYDTDLSLSLISDGYSSNKTDVGSYIVKLEATDKTGNKATKNVTVNVVDNVAPELEGPTTVDAPVSSGEKTLAMIKALFSANDEIDGDLTNSIEVVSDNFTTKSRVIGSHAIKFRVTDSAGNETDKVVTVNVIDDDFPTIFVDETIIPTSTYEQLSLDEIKNMVVVTLRAKNISVATLTVITDEYSGNEDTPGTYDMEFAYTTSRNNGLSNTRTNDDNIVRLQVTVFDAGVIENLTEDLSKTDRLWQFYHENTIAVWAGAAVGLIGFIGIVLFKKK